jgi:predicted helicase
MLRDILSQYKDQSTSLRNQGDRFEALIQAYLLSDPRYSNSLSEVWLWMEFPFRDQFGGNDTGIDLVAKTNKGDYWAIQCKFFDEASSISKGDVDSFLSTSSRTFDDERGILQRFNERLWVSTTNNWSSNAEEVIKNQDPPVARLNLQNLLDAPVDWGKINQGLVGKEVRREKKSPRPHQVTAINSAKSYFLEHDRGKLIMACGTGKTYTALQIAEETTNNGLVLFLVPSIALLGQTLREWSADARTDINPIAICSDPKITKQRKGDGTSSFSVVDLAFPASTDPQRILNQFDNFKARGGGGMTVVFSTYQSIDVIAEAQKTLMDNGYPAFDLVVCDEAHRTTGVSVAGQDESAFIKVHDNDFIKAKKRLYMTATPRLFSDEAKSTAAQEEATLCSMDDPELYGEEIYRIGFGKAVEKGLLTDYKVLILTLNDQDVPPGLRNIIGGDEKEIKTDDLTKIVGTINALSKQFLGDSGNTKDNDPGPMKRGVAFCSNIATSKKITETYNLTSEAYRDELPEEIKNKTVVVESQHMDGTMSAPYRDQLLSWLKEDTEENDCRILTNVRVLSEGVDVPSLDSVLFLSARNSQVDVVQSVGRVMRLSPGKKYGYIVIPVVVPSDVEPEVALNDNERFKVVWTVLNALRAHDDRFNATVNKIDLNKKKPDNILIAKPGYSYNEDGSITINDSGESSSGNENLKNQLAIQFEQLQTVVYARLVKKVGDRMYWEQWAKDVAAIAQRQIERIQYLIDTKANQREAFNMFLLGLQKNINPSISQGQAVEMLAQHIITQPVFEALFEGYSFQSNNAVSIAMQGMLDRLEEGSNMAAQDATLQKFYESVRKRVEGIDNAEGKQKIIVELYDKFFKTAFPKMVEQLGIVYTPVEVVDFIIHSVEDVLQQEFGRSISDENIHVLDPFTGTGTFITRLLQSGLIKPKDLDRKFKNELHANELVLLAYYIAAVNIENAYHDQKNPEDPYESFDGIVLTDTFQLGESDGDDKLFSEMFPKNSERVKEQRKAPMRVIIGNPPYSIGQKSANDNAQNQSYDRLDARIAETYAKESNAGLNKSLYDAYIKAFRWSSDRIDKDNGGVIAFVTNGAWIDGNSTDGFRKSAEKEFDSIWVFNLRGNQRTSNWRKEGGKIFGSGAQTPICVTVLVKNPKMKTEKAEIFYHDIGEYLSREKKLEIISDAKSLHGNLKWKTINPNSDGDWINQRNEAFSTFPALAPNKKEVMNHCSVFSINGPGIVTSRDAWSFNYSKDNVKSNITRMIEFYNIQMNKFQSRIDKSYTVENFIDMDPSKISWTRSLRNYCMNGKKLSFDNQQIIESIYRPFNKVHLYYDKHLTESPGIQKNLFSDENRVILVSGKGGSKDFSCLISNKVVCMDTIEKAQVFPLFIYSKSTDKQASLFSEPIQEIIKRPGVSDAFKSLLDNRLNIDLDQKDIFYFVYGILHSEDYRASFANDLKKMLPRIPLVDSVKEFWAFSKAGRQLADLHLDYENVAPYTEVTVNGDNGNYHVTKMKFPKKGVKDTIIYNSQITISNIPEKAYEYVVNGKSAIEWIMERYQIKTDKKSGITNDPNDWCDEVNNPRYILDLLLSIINVSVQTVDIVNNLPKLNFEE